MFKDIQPGQLVWLGTRLNPRRVIRAVARITRTQIIIDMGGLSGEQRYAKSGRRFGKHGSSFFGDSITALATGTEFKAFLAAQTKKGAEIRAQQEQRDAFREKVNELNSLFGDNVIVSAGETDNTFNLTIENMTEEAVRVYARRTSK